MDQRITSACGVMRTHQGCAHRRQARARWIHPAILAQRPAATCGDAVHTRCTRTQTGGRRRTPPTRQPATSRPITRRTPRLFPDPGVAEGNARPDSAVDRKQLRACPGRPSDGQDHARSCLDAIASTHLSRRARVVQGASGRDFPDTRAFTGEGLSEVGGGRQAARSTQPLRVPRACGVHPAAARAYRLLGATARPCRRGDRRDRRSGRSRREAGA